VTTDGGGGGSRRTIIHVTAPNPTSPSNTQADQRKARPITSSS
jgi:hypothetical protein